MLNLLGINFADPAIIAAIITGIATVAAALVVFLKDNSGAYEKKKFRDISKVTAQNLAGTWVGHTKVFGDGTRKYKSNTRFTIKGQMVTGVLHIIVENAEKENKGWELNFSGGFVKEGFLQIDYWNPDAQIRQFGSIIYEFKPPSKLEGRFVAMGRDLGSMICGEAELEKQP